MLMEILIVFLPYVQHTGNPKVELAIRHLQSSLDLNARHIWLGCCSNCSMQPFSLATFCILVCAASASYSQLLLVTAP